MYYLCRKDTKSKTYNIMKRLFLALVALVCVGAVSAQVAPYGIVDANIMDSKGENIVISRGTPVVMDIEIQRAKGVGKAGYIKINCVSTTAVDGQRINLIGTNIAQGNDRKGMAIGLGVGLGIVVCPPCFFCLCIKGENVVIPENTVLGNIVVNDNYTISVQ